MKKINLLLVSLVTLVTLSIGLSSCGGVDVKGKTFMGTSSDGYYCRIEFENNSSICNVRISAPSPHHGWFWGEDCSYTIDDNSIIHIKNDEYDFLMNPSTLVLSSGSESYKLKESSELPWD